MACFLVPGAEAVVVTAAAQVVKARERKKAAQSSTSEEQVVQEGKIPLSQKLRWLYSLLWGGVLLLAFEHLWHGEVTPWFPFLTAAKDPAETAVMLSEMSTVGVTMAVLVTVVWIGMVVVAGLLAKRTSSERVAAR